MAFTVTDQQQVTITATVGPDAQGNVVTGGTIQWTQTNPAAFTLTPSADTLSTVAAGMADGTSTITATYVAADGTVSTVSASEDGTVGPGGAGLPTGLTLNVSAPQPKS